MVSVKRLAFAAIVLAAAGVSFANPVQLDLSSGFTYDTIISPGEFDHAYNTLVTDVYEVYPDHSYMVTQGYGLVVADTLYNNTTSTVTADGVAVDGVITAATSGTVYHMASLAGNATYAGDWTQAADPTTLAGMPNAMVVMSSHNKNSFQIASASAVLPAAQQGKYSDINFLISSSAQSHETSQMEIYAEYADGSRQLLWTGFEDSPKMTDNATTAEWQPALTFNTIYNSTSGEKGNVEDNRGTFSMYEFTAPLALDDTKDLVGITLEDNNPDKNWFARGGMIFAATATAVPEPATMSLLALGGLALARRRRK